MILSLNVTPVFHRAMHALADPRFHVFVFEGGSRSSKTYSLIQLFIVMALRSNKRKRIACLRKKGTWLLATVWHDFGNILSDMGLLGNPDVKINNSKYTIRIKQWEFEFFGLDDVQRLHGLTCDIFWINEAMEATKDDFDQLEQRCAGFGILDYNPTAEEHWIYDNVCNRDDCYFDHSTMLDNPMIPENMKRKILSYEPTEENYRQGTVDIRKWKIYGLGERASIEGLIFHNVKMIDEIPFWVKTKWRAIDWGFTTDPTAIETVGYYKNALYIDEECYRTGMLNSDIIKVLKTLPPLKIWADNAEPKTIAEIRNAGFFINAARKGSGSIVDGIQFMQGLTMYITSRSVNIWKEVHNYTWQQDKEGKWHNIPVDDYNHALDGIRYVCYNELMGRKNKGKAMDISSAFAH